MVQLSHPYMTIGKTIFVTIRTFVGKVMSMLFIHCLGLSYLFFQGPSVLISRLQSPPNVILEPKKIKSVTASTFSPSIYHEVMGLDAMILNFLNIEFKVSLFTGGWRDRWMDWDKDEGWNEGRSWHWVEKGSILPFINLTVIYWVPTASTCWALWVLQNAWDLKSV